MHKCTKHIKTWLQVLDSDFRVLCIAREKSSYSCGREVRDRAWYVRLYGEIIPSFNEGIIDRTGAQTMLYLTCTIISSVDLAHHRVSCAKDWVSVECGTI